jgi:hypothetical protein
VPIHKGNQHSWPIGHAVVFTWTDDDGPHRAIDDMLDVMEIDAVRTSFEGRDAIVGLLGDRRTHQPLNLNSPTPIRHALRQTQQVVSELRLSVQHTAFAWPLRAHYLAFCNLRP